MICMINQTRPWLRMVSFFLLELVAELLDRAGEGGGKDSKVDMEGASLCIFILITPWSVSNIPDRSGSDTVSVPQLANCCSKLPCFAVHMDLESSPDSETRVFSGSVTSGFLTESWSLFSSDSSFFSFQDLTSWSSFMS